jgi:periplasmic divalent cation tolerance protein
MNDAIQIVTTFPTRDAAEAAARELIERRLAACAQIGGPVTSVYRWQGAVESAEEFTLTLKARRDMFELAAAVIGALHSYEVPEILAFDVVAGSEAYLRWIEESVTRPE